MVNKLKDISSQDKIFIDANILIFLFSPDYVANSEQKVKKYTQVFLRLIENKNELIVNSLVISEFINKCLRIDFEKNFQDEKRTKDFKKDYRNSSNYKNTIKAILVEINKITKYTKQIDDDFSNFDITNAYSETIDMDFTDLIIKKTVKNNNYKLLTDDRDFGDMRLSI